MQQVPRSVILAEAKRQRDTLASRVKATKESIDILSAAGKRALELDPEKTLLSTPLGQLVNGMIGAQLTQLNGSLIEGLDELDRRSKQIEIEERLVKPSIQVPNLAGGGRRQ